MAVENEWGGRDSVTKADALFDEILSFFSDRKPHYADDLELILEDAMLEDFNTEVQDDSPREVAKALVALHSELMCGNTAILERFRAAQQESQLARAMQDMTVGTGAQPMERRRHVDSDSSSESDEDMDTENETQDTATEAQTRDKLSSQHKGPIIDDDGFQLVTGKKGRG